MIGSAGEFKVVAFFIQIDKSVRIHLLNFSIGGRTHVHFVAAGEQGPLRASVEPGGDAGRSEFEAIALHTNLSAHSSVFRYTDELGGFELSFNTSAGFEFAGGLV